MPPVLGVAGAAALHSFGSFAGYIWLGRAHSVSASWTVPRVLRPSPPGYAATWIGAQGPNKAFIQIGTVENGFWPAGRKRPLYQDFAFWSDSSRHYRAVQIFSVRPGDRLAASLALTAGRWMLAIVDRTSGKRAGFGTDEEAKPSFNQLDWLQEDPRSAATHRPLPYPSLSEVDFGGLRANSALPSAARLYASWMSLQRKNLAPSSLRDDSFALQAAKRITREGARYLAIVSPLDATQNAVEPQILEWNETTPATQIDLQRATFAAALSVASHDVALAHWSGKASRLVRAWVARAGVLLVQTRLSPPLNAAGRQAWVARWLRDGHALSMVAYRLRRTLGLPV